MDERVHAHAGAGEGETDRIDEKRPVVGDDQHLAHGALASGGGLRRQHFDERLAGATAVRQCDVSDCERKRFEWGSRGQVFFADADEVAAQQRGARRTSLATRCGDDPVDQ